MDIADKDSNAILRPGKAPRWRVVGTSDSRIVDLMHRARQKHTFGETVELAQHDSSRCCGALFNAEPDGGILSRQFWQLEYFFARDGAEAVVFEFDRWQNQFFARRLEELWNRRKI